jgi:hypothetical protein
MAGKRRERSGQRRIRGFAVSIGVAAFFLGFAAFISWLAPVHVLELRREEEGRIRADIGQRLLVVIPLQTRTLDGVTGVSTRRYAPPAYVNPDEPTARGPTRGAGLPGSRGRAWFNGDLDFPG